MDATASGASRRWVIALLALVVLAFTAPCAAPSPSVTLPVAAPSGSACPHGPDPGLHCVTGLATVGVRQRVDATGMPTDVPMGAVGVADPAAPLPGGEAAHPPPARARPPGPAGRELLTSLGIART